MKRSKRLLALALALCTVLAMAGCTGAEPEQMTMRAALVDAPVTLDPARAVTETEKTVAANLFENLMKQTAAGVVGAQCCYQAFAGSVYSFTGYCRCYCSR